MKIYAHIELPISVEAAFDQLMVFIRTNDEKCSSKLNIIKEVGDLGPGSIFEHVHEGRKTVTFLSEVTENTRPHTFAQKTDNDDASSTYVITFSSNGSTTIMKSCSTFRFKKKLLILTSTLFAGSYIRGRSYLDLTAWGPLFPNRVLKARHWCTIFGLPHYFASGALILSIFFIVHKILTWSDC